MSASERTLDAVPDVDIDATGTFKYVLLRIGQGKRQDKETSKVVVRGYQRAAYHVDILEEVSASLGKGAGSGKGLSVECAGGGRIKHEPEQKRLLVYGYSQGFGRADHQLAVDLLKVKYPDYEITWTNDGY